MFLLTACPGGGGEFQPVAENDAYTVAAGETSLEVSADDGVLDNDTGGSLAAEVAGNPTNGTVTLNADGSFTYTPTVGFSGTDTFSYAAVNSIGRDEATVTITVAGDTGGPGNGNGDDELEAEDDTYSTTLGSGPYTVPAATGLLANDTIPDGVNPTINVDQSGLEAGAVLAVEQDGSFHLHAPGRRDRGLHRDVHLYAHGGRGRDRVRDRHH